MKWTILPLLVLLASFAIAQEPVPELPRVYVDTTWHQPTGTVWHVHNSPQFSAALVTSRPGDAIVLDAGQTYTGNFTLPQKSVTGAWVYIESSALGLLPTPGHRAMPVDAPNMPKIVTPNTDGAFYVAAAANHYRLVGLEVYSASTEGSNQSLNPPSNNFTWALIYGPYTLGQTLPDSVVIDRCLIHGSDTQDVGQGVQLNFTNGAVVDSSIYDIHESTFDSQAILAYWTPGPLKVWDNYLSSGGENVMFGGAGGYNNPYVPSDIEIGRNSFENPLRWEVCGAHGTVAPGEMLADGTVCPASPSNQWIVKNNLEFKNARRVLAYGNIMLSSWVSAQTGVSVLFTIRTSQSGNLAVVDDITFQDNVIRGADSGISAIEQDNLCGAQYGYPNCTNPGESKRVKIYNNLFLLRPSLDTYQHGFIRLDGGNGSNIAGVTDYVIQHNTVLMSDDSALWGSVLFSLPQLSWGCTPPLGFSSTHNVWVLDNALTQQPDGDCGLVNLQGVTGLGYYMGDPAPLSPRFYGNAIFAPTGRLYSYPANNLVTGTPFVYVNPLVLDYQLASPHDTDTTDGRVSGIDWVLLEAGLGSPTAPVASTVPR